MDLDDLLEDVPDPKVKSNLANRKTKISNKKKTIDDEWGDLNDNTEPMEIKSSGGFGRLKESNATADFKNVQSKTSFGYGGETGLRKETVKKEEIDDEWGLNLDSGY